ncbi:MAG: hypothetical protein LBQ68_06215 [Clostridiales bacterium]|nr:hypothetical protein [Clostridiales bacterium]
MAKNHQLQGSKTLGGTECAGLKQNRMVKWKKQGNGKMLVFCAKNGFCLKLTDFFAILINRKSEEIL